MKKSWCAGLVVGISACATVNAVDAFKRPGGGGIQRASFELGCPEEQLQVTDLGGWTLGVSGCEKKAVYKWAAGAGWVNNTGADDSRRKEEKK